MKRELLEILRCPKTGSQLRLEIVDENQAYINEGWLVSDNGQRYAIKSGIARFVPAYNYAANFGFQWNKFRKTQLDSFSGHPITAQRFWSQSGWRKEDLQGRRVLDVGCGAGRFAEIALEAGAHLVALDYSGAVDACYANHRERFPNTLNVVQGDIYSLPFAPGQFDYVYCFGVLQHTPDVKAAFMSLPKQLRSGGRLAVDVYRKHWSNWVHPKYWLRPITTRLNQKQLFDWIVAFAPVLLRISMALKAIPLIGKALARAVPVANYAGQLPLRMDELVAWSILDTFDWLGPTYDQPQTAQTLQDWFREAGLVDVEVVHPAHLSCRGVKLVGLA